MTNDNTAIINQMLQFVTERKTERGVKQKGGKLYTVVADRVEALRRFGGDKYRIVTELLHYSPTDTTAPVLVRATIYNDHGAVISTGHAEEWRSSGYVNQTSAVENAETSAIGRALAGLGLHGGEYASANEIQIAEAKREHLSKDKGETTAQVIQIPVNNAKQVAEVEVPAAPETSIIYEAVVAFLPECHDLDTLMQFWTRNAAPLAELKGKDPERFTEIRKMFTKRKTDIEKATTNE